MTDTPLARIPQAGRGYGLHRAGGDARYDTNAATRWPDGRTDIHFDENTPFRVASVSKLLTAELARRLAADGRLDMDGAATDALGLPFAHPEFPLEPITLRRLLSHRSGVRDPDIYWMAAPGHIRDLFVPQMWEPGARPGEAFRYSNLNYGVAATVMEAATGERFDRLFTRYVAEPLGLDIGFNWSGVSAAKRARAHPGLRGEAGDWTVQIDGAEMRSEREPAVLLEPGFALGDYEPGTNGTLFSPQGGLRASLSDLLEIGRAVILPQTALHSPTWVWDGASPGSEDGHFTAFGEGLYIYQDAEPFGMPAMGHHGEAYGIYCGLFCFPETNGVFAFAELGSPPDGAPYTGGAPNISEPAARAVQWLKEYR